MELGNKPISFILREIYNQTRTVICKNIPKTDLAPQSQLQGGILGYLYHHVEEPVYQKDLEKEFRISRATATNTLQAMEKNGLLVRKALDKDARLKRITMTPEAEANQERVEHFMTSLNQKLVEGLSEQELQSLTKYLLVIQGNLEKMEQIVEALPLD